MTCGLCRLLKIYPNSRLVPEVRQRLAAAIRLAREEGPEAAPVFSSRTRPVAVVRPVTPPAGHETWLGYRSPEDAPLPPSLDAGLVEETVFQVLAISSSDPAKFPINLSSKGFENRRLEGLEPGTIKFNTTLLIYCARVKIPNCPVFQTGMSTGTAFVVGDGRTIVTALHVFGNWITTAVQNNEAVDLENLCPPFVLRNHQGKIVFNTLSGKDTCRTTKYPIDQSLLTTLKRETSTRRQSESDYLEVELDRLVSKRALSKASRSLSDPETRFYPFGYPADGGGGLVTSVGKFRRNEGVLIQHTGHSSPGMSGGQVLLDDGTVVGVSITGGDGFSEAYPLDESVLSQRFVPALSDRLAVGR